MTAQITIMNKSAIAFASDSAVTAQRDRKSKTYNTVNKLFTLSKFAPVGVMIFGNSEFLQTPWETIIKIYIERLERKAFKTIDDYATDFISFLYESVDLFPTEIRDQSLHLDVGILLYSLLNDIKFGVEQLFKDQEQVSETEIQKIAQKAISVNLSFMRSAPLLKHIDISASKEIFKNHRTVFESHIDDIFQKFPLTTMQKLKLLWICSNYPCRDLFDDNQSGVVIAGFGEEEVFPHVRSFLFQGIYRELLKYKPDKKGDISHANSATITPFAQSDMVGEFMEGCHPKQSGFIIQYLEKILKEIPKHISDKLDAFSSDEKDEFAKQFSEFSNGLMDTFVEDLKVFRRKEHIDPVINTVGFLPKEELATMAEALVNLTQFRQRMTMELETVGGPIDVAVISKGDGFIWINRKHYFKPELNQQFMMKYFLNEKEGVKDD